MKEGAYLVAFGDALPWGWRGLADTCIAKETLRKDVEASSVKFISLESLLEPGSIYEATALLEELPYLSLASGAAVSEAFVYKGFPLWWIHYNPLFLFFCLPFTQYRRLLESLKGARRVYVYRPPFGNLFRRFLEAHGAEMIELKERRLRSPEFIPFGVFVQIALTILFLPFVFLLRRPLLVFTGDKFEKGRDHDFRLRYIYEELRKRKIPFVEVIRGLEPWGRVLSHAWRRRRPVIYADALTFLARFLSILSGDRAHARKLFGRGAMPLGITAKEKFKYSLAMHYLLDVGADVWAIRLMSVILRLSGVRAAYITAANERNFTTNLACKLERIPTVGILHGFASRFYNAYDFMSGFKGEQPMGVDRYGVWSSWWRDYYLKYSKAYAPKSLSIVGPMRPPAFASSVNAKREGPLRVLFVAEQLAVPAEVLPFLEALLSKEDIAFHFKFRTYRDGFEDYLKAHRPNLLAKVPAGRVFRGTMQEAITGCDVVVGSHSTAVLEALLQGKPCVLFDTKKWGDYFELEPFNTRARVFAKTPDEFIDFVRKSQHIPAEILAELREMYFGDSKKNGSAWAVDQLEELLRAA